MPDKKPLAEWKHWRGDLAINKHLPEGLAVEWNGKLWCGTLADMKKIEQLIADDRLLKSDE